MITDNKMEFNYSIGHNGKPKIHISKDIHSTLFSGNNKTFKCKKVAMTILESNVRSIRPQPRKFVISIRMDGERENEGQFRLSQMSFDYDDLQELYNQIGVMLNDNN